MELIYIFLIIVFIDWLRKLAGKAEDEQQETIGNELKKVRKLKEWRASEVEPLTKLVAYLKHPRYQIRIEAIKTLVEAQGSGTPVYITDSLKDKSVMVRRYTIETLEKLYALYSKEYIKKGEFYINPRTLVSSLIDDDISVRSCTGDLLIQICESYGIQTVLSNLDYEKIPYGHSILPTVLLLKVFLNDTDSDIYNEAFNTFETIGGKSEPLIISEILKDNDFNSHVRSQAADYLSKFKNERTIKALKLALEDKDETVRLSVKSSLKKLGKLVALDDNSSELQPKSLDELVSNLKHPQYQTRIDAIRGLAKKAGNTVAAKYLSDSLGDKSVLVRR